MYTRPKAFFICPRTVGWLWLLLAKGARDSGYPIGITQFLASVQLGKQAWQLYFQRLFCSTKALRCAPFCVQAVVSPVYQCRQQRFGRGAANLNYIPALREFFHPREVVLLG